MGLFRAIHAAMNEEFILGERNIQRYEADPGSLEDILREQRSRGIGSARGLRRQAREEEDEHGGQHAPRGILDSIGRTAFGAGVGLLLAHAWQGRQRDE